MVFERIDLSFQALSELAEEVYELVVSVGIMVGYELENIYLVCLAMHFLRHQAVDTLEPYLFIAVLGELRDAYSVAAQSAYLILAYKIGREFDHIALAEPGVELLDV